VISLWRQSNDPLHSNTIHSLEAGEFLKLVLSIHSELVESLEWSSVASNEEQCAQELPAIIRQLCRSRAAQFSSEIQEELCSAVMAESVGLGPLEPLLADPKISDILVNRFDEVFVETSGSLTSVNVRFADDAHVMRIIQRIAARVGRRLDESSPVVDARMADGSRVHAVAPPLAVRGPTISIRRFSATPMLLDNLVQCSSMSSSMAAFLAAAVVARVSCLISGGTGAGKTTLLNALSANIPTDERIITIEDVTELRLVHPHVVSLEARNSNVDGRGEVSIRELVRNSLRMRPDRIVVGEVRGNEAIDMLQALNTGHEGSMTTIHANDTRDALARLELLVGMAGYDFSLPVLRQYVATGVKLLVHVGRQKGGVRRVLRIAELVAIKNGEYYLEDIFRFRQTGLDEQGRATGDFYATGYLPQCMERILSAGVSLSDSVFADRS
jgi:pilus assembly protein CpaF